MDTEFIRTCLEVATEGFWDWDLINDRARLSARYLELLGDLPPGTVFDSLFLREIIHPDDRAEVFRVIDEHFQGERDCSVVEYRMLRPDGKILWIEGRGRLIERDADGRPARMVGVILDISERKEAETALKASQELYRRFTALTSDYVYACTRHGTRPFRVQWLGGAVEDITGYSQEEIFAAGCWLPIVHPDDRERIAQSLLAMQPGDPGNEEFRIITQSGEIRWLQELSRCEAGDVPGELKLYGTARDITERKRIEERLILSERKFSTAFRMSPDSINLNRAGDGTYLEINQGFTAITGYQSEEVIGRTSQELGIWAHPADRDQLLQGLQQRGVINNLEASFRMKDGTIVTGLMSACLLNLEDEPCILSITRDMTREKQAEKRLRDTLAALQESEDRFRLLLNSTAEAIYGVDVAGLCTFCNQACIEILGVASARDLLGKNMHDLIHHTRQDGTPCPWEECGINLGLPDRQMVHRDDQIFWRSDGSWFFVEYWAHPIVKEGQVIGGVVTFHDISQRRQLEEQNLRSAQLASIGELAAGVAHEVNNPINGIINYAQLLLNGSKIGTPPEEILRRIIKEGDRIAEIVGNLLFFSRDNRDRMSLHDLDSLVQAALSLTRKFMERDGIRIETDLASDLPTLYVNPQKIEQLLINLMSNARHALNEKYPVSHANKRLRISAEKVLCNDIPHCRISLRDEGVGIAPASLRKIRQPFFTTKPAGVGTGLGLSICQKIVDEHDGYLRIDSRLGKFTQVTVDLPVRRPPTPNPGNRK